MSSALAAVVLFALALSAEGRVGLRRGGPVRTLAHSIPSQAGHPFIPETLAGLASSCKCKFDGLCTCALAMEFLDCIADACASGACDCHMKQSRNACHDMSATCPLTFLSCSETESSCAQTPVPDDETIERVYQDLEVWKMRKCRLEHAIDKGFINARLALRKTELPIKALMDALEHKGVPTMPNLECERNLNGTAIDGTAINFNSTSMGHSK